MSETPFKSNCCKEKFFSLFVICCLAGGCATGKGIPTSQGSSFLGQFKKVDSCHPVLEWEDIRTKDEKNTVTYEVAVHTVLESRTSALYERGPRLFFADGLKNNAVTIRPDLESGRKYFWSVRMRRADGRVTDWSVKQKSTVFASYYNQWYGIKTPTTCD